MAINAIIIDDEPLARAKLEAFIKKIPELALVYIFSDAREALATPMDASNTLIFLDIQMEEFTGLQFMEAMVNSPRIIITSAYEQYALKGFEYNVSDYLLKPYSFERFSRAVTKALTDIKMDNLLKKADEEFILVKSEYKTEKVAYSDILYIEGMKDYLRFHTLTGKIMTLRSFASLEKELPTSKFVRIHKSYIVSMNRIKSMEKDAVIVGEVRIPIGKSYKDRFIEKIKDLKKD